MALGTSLVLIAIGAVLRFAISVSTHGVNVHTIGVILMVVGAVGLVFSLLWMTVWTGERRRETRYVERDVPPSTTGY